MVERAQAIGGTALLVTVALPHTAADDLGRLLDDLQAVWRGMWSGAWATRFRRRFGLLGQFRAIEATWGPRTGWHCHIHAVVIFDRPLPDDALVEVWAALWPRFAAQAEGLTGRRPSFVGGLDVARVVDARNVSEYATGTGSWGIGQEVAVSTVKQGKVSDRWSPFALLASAALHGDAEAARLWDEWDEATRGRRAIVCSPGLAETLGVEVVDDDEAAEGPAVEDCIGEVEVEAGDWLALCAVDAQDEFVEAVERWAVAGCVDPPPHPHDVIRAAVARRAEERAR